MSDEQRSLLNDNEKKKLLDTAKVIYNLVGEISTKKKKRLWDISKHPIIVLIVGSLLSGYIVFTYQRNYERSVDKLKAKYDLSTEIVDEILITTGKILSKAKIITILHSEAITDQNQIINANKDYNTAYDDFISHAPKIRFKLHLVFRNDEINEWWGDIQNSIDDLDKTLNLMLEHATDDVSETHSERIDMCEKKIKEINSKLTLLYEWILKVFD